MGEHYARLRFANRSSGTFGAASGTAAMHVIDRSAKIFGDIAAASSRRVVFVDSRGTLTLSAQWANELHPSPAGFKKIATKAWEPLLFADNLA